MRLLLLITLCTFFLPHTAHADMLPQSVVRESAFWPSGHYSFDSFTIEKGVELIVQAPVTIAIGAGGEVQIHGVLTVLGGEALFTNRDMGYPWLGMTVTGGILRKVKVERSLQGVQVLGPITASDVRLRENRADMIRIREASQVRIEHGEFGPRNADGPPLFAGVWVDSPGDAAVDVWDVLFKGHEVMGGVKVEGAYQSLQIVNVRHERKCTSGFEAADRFTGASLVFWPDSCLQSLETPVLVVPGFGTSLHGKMLTSPDPITDTDGWFVLPALTPGQADLVKMIRQKLPAELCLYDWRRLPTDGPVEVLQKCIEEMKYRYDTDQVQVVAHSYGGIVTRTYVQSADYAGDISQVFTMGTPSRGSAKALQVWEQGLLPPDWQILSPVVRYYQSITGLDQLATIQQAFPGIQTLMPTYAPYTAASNQTLTFLDREKGVYLGRVRLTELYSKSRKTLSVTPDAYGFGDGTVLASSAAALTENPIEMAGGHAELAHSAKPYFAHLYGIETPNETGLSRDPMDLTWFYFDCPITATVTSPSGVSASTATGPPLFADQETRTVSSGEDGELRFVALPREEGLYTVEVTANETTHVRAWQDEGVIREWQQEKGVIISYQVVGGAVNTESTEGLSAADALVADTPIASLPPATAAPKHLAPHPLENTSHSQDVSPKIEESGENESRGELVFAQHNTAQRKWVFLSILLLIGIVIQRWYRVRVRSQ